MQLIPGGDPHDGLACCDLGRDPYNAMAGDPDNTIVSPHSPTHCMYRSGSALRAGPRSPTVGVLD